MPQRYFSLNRLLKSPAPWIVLALVVVELCGTAYMYWSERTTLKAQERNVELLRSYGGAHTFWPFEHAGVIQPSTVTAENASLRDREEVIGVEVNGKARAYRITAMHDLTQHVVNDKIDDVP